MDDGMSPTEFRKAVREADVVLAWVAHLPDDGAHFRVSKTEALRHVKGMKTGTINATLHTDQVGKRLFIN